MSDALAHLGNISVQHRRTPSSKTLIPYQTNRVDQAKKQNVYITLRQHYMHACVHIPDASTRAPQSWRSSDSRGSSEQTVDAVEGGGMSSADSSTDT